MAKMIYVDEDHNGNAIRNVGRAVGPRDAVILEQLEEAVASPLTGGPGVEVVDGVVSARVAGEGLTRYGGIHRDSLAVVPKPGGGVVAGVDGLAVDWAAVPPPTGPGAAVSKGYVDAVACGMLPLAAVQAASTGNIPGLVASSVDGVVLQPGDRVLVKDQDDPTGNGVYRVDSKGRLVREDGVGGLQVGSTVFVEQGTVNGDSSFSVNAAGGAAGGVWTPGTDPVTWVKSSQFTGYRAGAGIDLSGGTVSVVSGPGVMVDAGVVEARVDPAGGLEKKSGPGRDALAVFPAADGGVLVDEAGVSVKVAAKGGLRVGPDGLQVEVLGAGKSDVSVARVWRGRFGRKELRQGLLRVVHGLGQVPVQVQVLVGGCSATVGVCVLDGDTVQLEFGNHPGTEFEFEVVVTG